MISDICDGSWIDDGTTINFIKLQQLLDFIIIKNKFTLSQTMAPLRFAATVIAGFTNYSPRQHCYTKSSVVNLRTTPLVVERRTNAIYQDVDFLSLGNRQRGISRTKSQLHMATPGMLLGLDPKAALYMSMLALQFACQPILTKRFTPKSVNRSSIVMTQDVVKVVITLAALFITGSWSTSVVDWSIKSWLMIAALPAFLYSIQNFAALIAYQNLPPLTFNVLNQTKTLSAALSCYLLMGKVQSKLQIVSLLILFMSACIIEKLIPFPSKNKSIKPETSLSIQKTQEEMNNHTEGVVAILLASFISGIAGALTQKSLQSKAGCIGRNSYFFTLEISIASLFFMILSTVRSKDGKDIREQGFFHNWTPKTLIPIITNASGAILVGLVTKYAGAVKKGFALIFGLVISGVLQASLSSNDEDGKISLEQIVGAILAAFSLWMYNAFPAL